MYPIFRMAKEWIKFRNAPALQPFDTHVSTHICWPWDIDLWMELNNGRTLTLFDLGRLIMLKRTGILTAMATKRWGGTVAGASIRYRKRVRVFDKLELRTRNIGWDERFAYAEQSLWKDGTCCSHGLMRIAITDRNGMVPAPQLAEAMGTSTSPELPAWVKAWAEADALRPWPPQQ